MQRNYPTLFKARMGPRERGRRSEGWAAAKPDPAAGLHPDESGVLAGGAFVFAAGFVCVDWVWRFDELVVAR
jgi:hypothetical protein